MDIQNSTAVVAGGGSGLGEAAARCLVAAGIDCLIIDRDAERGQAVADSLGPAARFVQADITDADAISAALAMPRRFPLRIMVNTAFMLGGQRVIGRNGEPHDLDFFRRLIEVNITGVFNCTRLGAAAIAREAPLADGERGVIINTASIVAFDGQEGQSAYAAAKGAIVGMTLPLARDLRQYGIRVVTIAPGTFLTPPVAAAPQPIRDIFERSTLAPGRLGYPEEFGQFVLHACQNSYMNGDTFRLDGGARLPARDSTPSLSEKHPT
jgi:NAD(P)-dependent dehydrogenase (short-subunit alcohol dehydrogenase family)